MHKVSIATETVNMAVDLEDASANRGGNMPSAVPSGNHYYIAYEGVGTGVDHALMLTRVAK